MSKISLSYRCVSSLSCTSNNPRSHTPKQIRQVAASIKEFGWTNPILIDKNARVVAGHARLEAAKSLGIESVPTVCLGELSETQLRAYVVADNRLAELAGWDPELLRGELEFLSELEIDFDVTITGFDTPEVDMLIESSTDPNEASEMDALPSFVPNEPIVTVTGDLWTLGYHRLFCGDARSIADYEHLMDGERAQTVFADPPYNVRIPGHVSGHGAVEHSNFAMACGEMTEKEFTSFLESAFKNFCMYSVDGSIHFICMDWRHLYETLSAGRDSYEELKNICVWNKNNAGMGSFYRSKHELVLVFKSGTARHVNNVELGRHGRNRTNVWDYAGMSSFGPNRLEDLQTHPTVKPVRMVADAILDCSHRGGIVLDPFSGSGTTIMAAEQTGRRAYAMEIDPRFVDLAIRRWEKHTGGQAAHSLTGSTFQAVQAERTEGAAHE